jgi:hypothetical protein
VFVNLAVASGLVCWSKIAMNELRDLLLQAADALRDYERDGLAAKLEATADSLDEPVAWLWDGLGPREVTLDADEADGMWKPLYLAAAGEKL